MKAITVNLARIVFLFPGGNEITAGQVRFQDAAKALGERYGFVKVPQTLEEWQHPEGATFAYGRYNGIVLTKLVVYARGLSVETNTDTDDCEKAIQDLLAWAATTLGLVLTRPDLARRVYLSELTFVSEIQLDWLHPALKMLGERVSPFAHALVPEAVYETTGLVINIDDSNVKILPGAFTIARRTGVPFSQNTFFSSAPMPTAEHKKALRDFEAAILAEGGIRG